MKRKIYVGCSLTHAPDDFKKSIVVLKKALSKDYKILEFMGLKKGTPQDVFEWDTYCVRSCDLFVADCSYPSLGLGYELGVRLELNRPLLAIAQKNLEVSRLIIGATKSNFTFFRYDHILNILDMVHKKINQI